MTHEQDNHGLYIGLPRPGFKVEIGHNSVAGDLVTAGQDFGIKHDEDQNKIHDNKVHDRTEDPDPLGGWLTTRVPTDSNGWATLPGPQLAAVAITEDDLYIRIGHMRPMDLLGVALQPDGEVLSVMPEGRTPKGRIDVYVRREDDTSPRSHFQLRFNTKHESADQVWRVFKDGEEILAKGFSISALIYDEKTEEQGVTKYNVACDGILTMHEGHAYIRP